MRVLFFVIFIFLGPIKTYCLTLEELNTISKEEYIKQFLHLYKQDLCRDDQSFFKQCFSISEKTCINSVHKTVKSCLNSKIRIPAKLNFILDGSKISNSLGACAGEKFYALHKNNLAPIDICKVRKKW